MEDRLIAHYIKCREIIKSSTCSYLPSSQSPLQPARDNSTTFTTKSRRLRTYLSRKSSQTLTISLSSPSIGNSLSMQQAKAVPEIQSPNPVSSTGLLERSRMQLQDHAGALPGCSRSALREGEQQSHQTSQRFPRTYLIGTSELI